MTYSLLQAMIMMMIYPEYDRTFENSMSGKRFSATSVHTTFLWTVAIFGTVENTLLALSAFTQCRSRRRRPVVVLTGGLALVDLFSASVYIPYYTYIMAAGENADGAAVTSGALSACSALREIFLQTTNVAVSIRFAIVLHLLVIAVSKSLAERWFTSPKIVATVAILCLLKFGVFSLPRLLRPSTIGVKILKDICGREGGGGGRVQANYSGDDLVGSRGYFSLAMSVNWIEFAAMNAALVRIYVLLRRCRRYVGRNETMVTNYRRASVVVRATLGSTCIFWFPAYVVGTVDPAQTLVPDAVHALVLDVLLLRVVVDPVIVICGFQSVRLGIDRVCLGKCSKWRQAREPMVEASSRSSTVAGQSTRIPGAGGGAAAAAIFEDETELLTVVCESPNLERSKGEEQQSRRQQTTEL